MEAARACLMCSCECVVFAVLSRGWLVGAGPK